MRRIFLLISLFAVLLSCTQMAPAASGDNSSTDQPNVPSQPSGPEDEGYDIFLLIGPGFSFSKKVVEVTGRKILLGERYAYKVLEICYPDM